MTSDNNTTNHPILLLGVRPSGWDALQLERNTRLGLSLPFDAVMKMADRLMLRIKTELRTEADWEPVEKVDHAVTLRWHGSEQLELELSFSPYGFLASLYPDFTSHGNFQKLLVGWNATRCTSPLADGWPGGEPGAVDIHRLNRFHETGLQFDDPLFAELPRVPAKHLPGVGEPTELVADIVEVTQSYLKGLAA